MQVINKIKDQFDYKYEENKLISYKKEITMLSRIDCRSSECNCFSTKLYNLLNDKKALKIFGPRTWCTMNLSVIESHSTDTFQSLVQD